MSDLSELYSDLHGAGLGLSGLVESGLGVDEGQSGGGSAVSGEVNVDDTLGSDVEVVVVELDTCCHW